MKFFLDNQKKEWVPVAIVQKGMSNQQSGDKIWLAAKLTNWSVLTIHNARPGNTEGLLQMWWLQKGMSNREVPDEN